VVAGNAAGIGTKRRVVGKLVAEVLMSGRRKLAHIYRRPRLNLGRVVGRDRRGLDDVAGDTLSNGFTALGVTRSAADQTETAPAECDLLRCSRTTVEGNGHVHRLAGRTLETPIIETDEKRTGALASGVHIAESLDGDAARLLDACERAVTAPEPRGTRK